ncbi:outer membrane beta-barrel protein [Pontibacter sp. 172403-2]|uniref:outer membrane beta-barrel protein n=1 Tax=Pontibacter rufus TaxID=2791028 RepID=UPI0018AFE6AD|nr:outer membrane beta-barrel protein [Pontibacter sp. 172403-2]MBF9254441.1 outer membrane beta-barrel protein [Pontibacter sp. 172403-2]
MKHILITALLALLGTGALAQTSQGTVTLSGGLSISSSSSGTDENNKNREISFSITPKVGYFIADNLELGISSTYRAAKFNTNLPGYKSVTKEHSQAIGTYLKKYFMLGDKVAVHATANLNYVTTRQKASSTTFQDIGSQTSETFSDLDYFGLNFSPGITFFPTEKIGLGASFGNVGYGYRTESNRSESDSSKSNSSNIGLDLSTSSLVFSFNYYLNR